MTNRELSILKNSHSMLNVLYELLPIELKNVNTEIGKNLWDNYLSVMVDNENVINNPNLLLSESAADLLNALKDIIRYHSNIETFPNHKLGGTMPFLNAKEVIRKATKI